MTAVHWSRLTLSALLFTAVSSPAADRDVEPPSDPKAEAKKWNGTYTVVLFERDGVKTPEAELRTMKVVSKGGEGSFHVGAEVYTSQGTLFPDRKPKAVDSTYTNGPLRGQTIKGIYKIEGERYTCCYAAPGKDRPKEFKTAPGSGLTLYVLRRVKGK